MTTPAGNERQQPTVSVIIPVLDESEKLRGCLQALLAQDYPADRYEVVVVDNGSTEDLSAVMPDDNRFALLREDRPGSYAARNLALELATGEVLAFTDGDCVPDPTWLTEAVRALTEPTRADMVGGAVELFYRNGTPRSSAELYEAKHGFPQEAYLRTQQFAVTANMLTWRDVIDRVGPFDARLRSRGDAEFGQRVAAAGLVQRYAPGAVVRHPARETWDELMTKVRRVAVGRRAADQHAGMPRVHFLRLAWDQIRIGARTTGAVVVLNRYPRDPKDKARYLGAYLYARGMQAAVLARGALDAPVPGVPEVPRPSGTSPASTAGTPAPEASEKELGGGPSGV